MLSSFSCFCFWSIENLIYFLYKFNNKLKYLIENRRKNRESDATLSFYLILIYVLEEVVIKILCIGISYRYPIFKKNSSPKSL